MVKFNSASLNMRLDDYHDDKKAASDEEKECILETLIRWQRTRQQNWFVCDKSEQTAYELGIEFTRLVKFQPVSNYEPTKESSICSLF